ncbi:MAG TPA: cysteine desulfurase family protein [Thermoanaerobaculia bacterium]|nr:cysteine desulfurase family protein [Thermoanaerobaculia bacterium]
MRIYFDHNATTPMHPRVLEALTSQGATLFGNASSVHQEGRMARRALEEAREQVARLLDAQPKEIILTSGGTESNNAALYGAIFHFSGDCSHIVTTSIEHPSVLGPCRDLASRGSRLTLIAPGPDGVVAADSILHAITPETRLVSMMLANNETGVLQPVAEVARFCRERGIHMHCDAVQAVGKIPVSVRDLGVDSLGLSGHKLYGPKGIGALYVREGVTLHPHQIGGTQERRRRAGTENVPLAIALGVAAEIALQESDQNERVARLRDQMEEEILAEFPDVRINGGAAPRLPNTSSVLLPGCDAESMVIGLDLEGVAVSSGSACHSGRVEASHVLVDMGLSDEEARSCIRVSLGRSSRGDETETLVRLLKRLVPMNRQRGALAV